MHWHDAAKTLAIGERKGTFNVVVISSTRPVPYNSTEVPDKTVTYNGREVSLRFN